MTVIDAWIQHPTPKFLNHPMFASLRKWMGMDTLPDTFPAEWTIAALDAAGVDKALVSAWWGPEGPLLSNDEVAALMARWPVAIPPQAIDSRPRCALRFRTGRASGSVARWV